MSETPPEHTQPEPDAQAENQESVEATPTPNDQAETITGPFYGSNDSLGEMMALNYLKYASYVIKDRAIPELDDGLKPVQRRILHSLNEVDDGRFHKVANIIGHTMQYHPHGDQSIGSALVVLANKEYFIEKQGNFGNILTGDQASAPRYIECRLTPLAREVLFNKELTEYIDSYDGRKKEPVCLPAKIPVVLLLGSDGIAVGMSTHIMPHNFNEVLKAQIAVLRNKSFRLYPDFFGGGLMDVSDYDDGNGRIKVRAKIDTPDNKTLVVREVPPTTTTESLMNSVEEAARKGKIKIASINDYTTDRVEIEIKLPRGIYAEDTMKRLYAYTDCEVGITASLVVINDNRPEIMNVSDILRSNTEKLVELLRLELDIERGKLQSRFHDKTLAQIFIENRIYKRIEESKTYDSVMQEVRDGLEPFKDQLQRPITNEDIEKLLQIQIRRISRFDIDKNQQELDAILKAIDKVQYNLDHLTDYTITYIKNLLKTYGKQYPRRTDIDKLETIRARDVALKNIKVGHDRVGHFVGSDVHNSNKNEEPIACSEFDRLVLMQNNGKFKIIPVPERAYVGSVKYVLKANKDQVYSMIYRHRKSGRYYVKRFRINRYIMNKMYSTIPKGCIIENLYTNYGVVVRAEFKHRGGKDDTVDIDFANVEMRSTGARGFKLTDREITSFTQVRRGTPEPPPSAPETDDTTTEESTPPKKTVDKQAPADEQQQRTGKDRKKEGSAAAKDKPEKNVKANAGKRRSKKTAKATVPKKTSAKTASAAETGQKTRKKTKKKKKPAAHPTGGKNRKQTSSSKSPTKQKAKRDTKRTRKVKTPSSEKKSRLRIDEETPFFLE